MAVTIRTQIAAAVFALINGAGRPAGTQVHRKRARYIANDRLPAIVVYLFSEPVEAEDHDGTVSRKLTIRAECRAAGSNYEEELEPLIAWVETSVLPDRTLGGLAMNAQVVRITWAAEEADQDYYAAAVDIEVEYVTQRDNPEQPG